MSSSDPHSETLALLTSLGRSTPGKKRARPASAPHRKAVWWGMGAGVILLLLGVCVWMMRPAPPSSPAPVSTTPASTTPAVKPPAAVASSPSSSSVAPSSLTGLSATGYVVARQKATLASEVTATVQEVLVEEGDQVETGQVLARLDATLQHTAVALKTAQLAAAKARVVALTAEKQEADRIAARYRVLRQTDTISDARLTDVVSRSESPAAQKRAAESEVEAASLALQSDQELLEKYTLRAPYAGVVVEKTAQAGEIISPNSAGGGFTRTGICTIVSMDSLEVEVDVNEAYIARVRADQNAIAVLDAYPQWRIPARVIAVIPAANRDKATIRVRVALIERDQRVLPDMAVKVVFQE